MDPVFLPNIYILCIMDFFCITFDITLKTLFLLITEGFGISRLVPHKLHSSPGPGVDGGGEGVTERRRK